MVRVAVEALHQQDMDKLELGLSRLYQADPAVEVTHPCPLSPIPYLLLIFFVAGGQTSCLSLSHAKEFASNKPV